jgi:hypothetical protein
MWVKQNGKQSKALKALFEPNLLKLSKACVLCWSDLERLDNILSTYFSSIPYCHLIYAVDKSGKQVSSNINPYGIDYSYRNQDLSKRPYAINLYSKRDFMLSPVYISQNTGRPCISAIHSIRDDSQQFLGFVVADFDLRNLPLAISSYEGNSLPHNCKRRQASEFDVTSAFDKYPTELQGILTKLISEHGLFHVTIHYASAQVMLWSLDDPYEYRIYDAKQLLDQDMYLLYSRLPYPANAKVSMYQVQQVLELFNNLRGVDEQIYLCSGSLNIMNGMVGLSFSFDGTQYMSVEEFLNKNWYHWLETVTLNIKESANRKKAIFPIKKDFDKYFFSSLNTSHSVELM